MAKFRVRIDGRNALDVDGQPRTFPNGSGAYAYVREVHASGMISLGVVVLIHEGGTEDTVYGPGWRWFETLTAEELGR